MSLYGRRWIFGWDWKTATEGAEVTCSGRLFYIIVNMYVVQSFNICKLPSCAACFIYDILLQVLVQ